MEGLFLVRAESSPSVSKKKPQQWGTHRGKRKEQESAGPEDRDKGREDDGYRGEKGRIRKKPLERFRAQA